MGVIRHIDLKFYYWNHKGEIDSFTHSVTEEDVARCRKGVYEHGMVIQLNGNNYYIAPASIIGVECIPQPRVG